MQFEHFLSTTQNKLWSLVAETATAVVLLMYKYACFNSNRHNYKSFFLIIWGSNGDVDLMMSP